MKTITEFRVLFQDAVRQYMDTDKEMEQCFNNHLLYPLKEILDKSPNSGGSGGQSTINATETIPESFDGSKVAWVLSDEAGQQTAKILYKGPAAKHLTAADAKAIADAWPLAAIVDPIMTAIKESAARGFHHTRIEACTIPDMRKDEVYAYLEGLGYKVRRGRFDDEDDTCVTILW